MKKGMDNLGSLGTAAAVAQADLVRLWIGVGQWNTVPAQNQKAGEEKLHGSFWPPGALSGVVCCPPGCLTFLEDLGVVKASWERVPWNQLFGGPGRGCLCSAH